MKSKDLSALLSRAAAAIEDPEALARDEILLLVEDLVVAASVLDTAPSLSKYIVTIGYANGYDVEDIIVESSSAEEAQRLAVEEFENEGDAGLVAAVYWRRVEEGEETPFDDGGDGDDTV